jgi:hypothetical protein
MSIAHAVACKNHTIHLYGPAIHATKKCTGAIAYECLKVPT